MRSPNQKVFNEWVPRCGVLVVAAAGRGCDFSVRLVAREERRQLSSAPGAVKIRPAACCRGVVCQDAGQEQRQARL